ncbi:high frequency lysogenization protein HflD [Motiliproteus sp. SC1-56]|uniref:high frequency lysogenization protein HflD n=1 Tax=Motiliproteus sp. SC1-56 TaxID=2799565 RepID=UPI001A8EB9CF|nr:high frequency lysogenization protein HflD [Motiliproteus sp. SC1-56]
MSRTFDEQAIALAGVFQAASLVDQVARRGLIPQNSFEASINSIFVTSPKATEDVFGGREELPYNLSLGLKSLLELGDKRQSQGKELTRYALSMLHLEARLNKTPQMLDKIGQRLDQIQQQSRFFDDAQAPDEGPARYTHPKVIANIAGLYQETLSTFSFRIQVTGEPRNLQNNDNADKIRALLLAGIRAAILWRQVGGRRWHLLFFRSRVAKAAQRILDCRR